MSSDIDYTGYTVQVPDQHTLEITRKYTPTSYWWKCRDCIHSSGEMSIPILERLQAKGMLVEPDGKKIGEYSAHPKEKTGVDAYDYERFWCGD